MFDFIQTPTETYPPSEQEFALWTRQIEEQQARMAAEVSESDNQQNHPKMGLLDLIVRLFGGPTLF